MRDSCPRRVCYIRLSKSGSDQEIRQIALWRKLRRCFQHTTSSLRFVKANFDFGAFCP